MSAEIATEQNEPEVHQIDVDMKAAAEANPRVLGKKRDGTPVVQSSYAGLSPALKAVKLAEDSSLKDIIEALGQAGHYRIRVTRSEPDSIRDAATGKSVPCAGFLKTYEKEISEELIQKEFGGGVYVLEFRRRNQEGKYVLFTSRQITIAGEPDLTSLPKSFNGPVAGAPVAAAPEPAGVVTKAMEFMATQVEQANQRADRREEPSRPEKNPAMDQLLEMMKLQVQASKDEVAELRRELAAQRNVPPPPVDTYKERMLDKMLDGDSARLQAVRMQYESELRTAKDNSIAEEKRLREVFERDKADMRAAHQREMDLVRHSNEQNLLAIRQSNEISLAAAKSSFETQMKLAEAENRRLERDNTELRSEVKDLRAKKDKTLLEQVKDVETIKEALGVGEGEDKTTGQQILDVVTNPEAWAAAGSFFKKKDAPAAEVSQQSQRQQVFSGPNGQRFVAVDGKLVPAKRRKAPRPQVVAAPGADPAAEAVAEAMEEAPVEAPVPHVDQEDLDRLIGFFESAYAGNQPPDIVAQGVRPKMPEEVLAYLRDRVAEQGLPQGVDLFLSKVARLPGTSSLATQGGRNWIRKVAEALVG